MLHPGRAVPRRGAPFFPEVVQARAAAALRGHMTRGYASRAARVPITQIVPSCDIRPRAPIDSVFVLSRHQGSTLVGPLPGGAGQLIDPAETEAYRQALLATFGG